MSRELARIEIPVYVRTVLISKARNKKYFEKAKEKKKPLPLKYSDNTRFKYRKKGINECLYDYEKQEFVTANPKAQGTPKVDIINGQAIYNGYISKWSRAKMMNVIKDNFQTFINTMNPITNFPIKITMEVHDLIRDPLSKNQLWDLGNRAFTYMKKFEDCLAGNKLRGVAKTKQIIPDDNVLYITGLEYKFIPITEDQERKLVFIIEKNV